MGGIISKVFASKVIRPLKNYNLEARAFKEISKDKPRPAPPLPSVKKIMDQVKRDPDLLNKGRPSPESLGLLNQVYVRSAGDNPEFRVKKRRLPEERKSPEELTYGYIEPSSVPRGKLSLRQALEFLEKSHGNPETYTPEVLAQEYNLELATANNIHDHFRPFQIYIPKQIEDKSSGAQKLLKLAKYPFKLEREKTKIY